VGGNDEYDLVLVDTAGQDEHAIFPPEYSANIHGYVLVYSIDSSKSYEVCEILHEKLIDLKGHK
jgi:Ras family protein